MNRLLTTTAVCAAMFAGSVQAQENWNLQSTYRKRDLDPTFF